MVGGGGCGGKFRGGEILNNCAELDYCVDFGGYVRRQDAEVKTMPYRC